MTARSRLGKSAKGRWTPGQLFIFGQAVTIAALVAPACYADDIAAAAAVADATRSADPAAVPGTAGGLEDIIVTARKRPENIQKTPIAITALTAKALEDRGVSNISQIENMTPSLTFRGNAPISGNPSAAVVFLRGVGQLDFSIFTDPGVGIYVDGVYVARSTGAVLDLVDPERIEVLRGPQGTLFGRNTIGGAINLISKQPGPSFGGDLAVTTGSFNRLQVKGNVDVPLSDTLFTRFSLLVHKRDGYVTRLQTGEDMGNDNTLAGRAELLWKPTSSFSATLAGDATRKRENGSPSVALGLQGTGYVNLATSTLARAATPGNGTFAYLFNRLSAGHPADPLCTSNPNVSLNCFGAAYATNNPYTTNGTFPAKANLDVYGIALTMAQQFSWATLKSITAYRDLSDTYGKDTDSTPFDFAHITYKDEQHQFSQEFQLSGRFFADRLKWVVGAYYFKETGRETFNNHNPLASTLADTHIQNENLAGFGEGTYDLTNWFHLTAGIRYTHETKRFRTDQFIGYQDPAILAVVPLYRTISGARLVADNGWQNAKFAKWTPRFTAAADLGRNTLAYGTYSRGFKSGGFDGRYVPGFNPRTFQFVLFKEPNRYQPEELTLYEVGLKFTTSDHTFRANTAVFRSDYSNLQVPYSPPGNLGVSYLANAAKARIQGVETELNLIPFKGFEITAGGSYLDAKYLSIDPVRVPTIPITARFPVTPKWILNGSILYAADLRGHGTLTPRADLSYRSSQANDAANSPGINQPGYTLLDATLTYESQDRLWRVIAGVTNLTDVHYLTSAGTGSSFGVIEGVYGRPREWVLTLKRNF